jgi:hypothetical protein
MKKKFTKYLSFSRLKVLVLLLSVIWKTNAGFSQKILAQYPLETEGQSILRLYDVSGNGNHAQLIKNTNNATANIFQGDSFANGITCIKKVTKDDAKLLIPDPYKNYDFGRQPFTVTFWLYIDNTATNLQSVSSVLFTLPAFSLIMDKSYFSNLTIAYHTANTLITYLPLNVNLENQGWYYLAITYDPFNPYVDAQFSFVFYYYNGINYDYDINALVGNTYRRTPMKEPSTEKSLSGSIYSEGFEGKMWNLTFYDEALSAEQLNNDRNNAWDISQKKLIANRYYYIDSAALAFYPCKKIKNSVIGDFMHGRTGTGINIDFTSDRFNHSNEAIEIQPDGYVFLPAFYLPLLDDPKAPVCNPEKGFTISFWTKIDQAPSSSPNASIPYTSDDPTYQILFIYKTFSDLNQKLIGGISMIRDRLVINRYIPLNPPRPWQLWLWDPVSFENLQGWYHIVYSQKENAIRVVMFKPDNSEACRLNYFMAQNYDSTMKFGFGNPFPQSEPHINAIKYLDDVRIYNWPFSQAEAEALHSYEMIPKD